MSLFSFNYCERLQCKIDLATKRDGAEAIHALLQFIIAAVFNEYVGKETLAAEK